MDKVYVIKEEKLSKKLDKLSTWPIDVHVVFETSFDEVADRQMHFLIWITDRPREAQSRVQPLFQTNNDFAVGIVSQNVPNWIWLANWGEKSVRIFQYINKTLFEKAPPRKPNLLLAFHDEYRVEKVPDILFCKSDGNYTYLFSSKNIPYLVSKNLGRIHERLKEYNFIRIHHQYLINLSHVQQFKKGDNLSVILSNGKRVPVARNKRKVLEDALKGYCQFI